MSYVKGTFIKSIYSNKENGYIVGVLKIKDTDLDILETKLYFTGVFYEIKEKNNYTLYGELVMHPKYGQQFNVSNYELLLPTKEEELIEFLSSDIFPMGEKTAFKIVDRFKDKSLDVILNNPEKLQLIPKLPKKRIDKIHNALKEYQYSSEIVINLNSLGFTSKQSLAIVNKLKNKTMDIISKNIYDLIDIMDFNFKDIDTIALNSGLEELDDNRIQALIIYIINDVTFESGNTYITYDEIMNNIQKYNNNINDTILEDNILKLNKKHKLIIKKDKYYLKEFYDAENYISDRLCYLNDLSISKFPKLDEFVEELEKSNSIKYDKTQKLAITKAINNNLTIITGGPGTGKTTIIKAIVKLLKKVYKAKNEEIALLAPTGRAAKKMMETTNINSSTIHRYLGWDKDTNTFSYNEYNKNHEKYIIVDEVSMLDTLLTSALLKGIHRDSKLILVGDYYQLPSVSQGQVLKDLIDSEAFDVIKLHNIHRQNKDSYIPTLANEIKDKDLSESFVNKKDDYNFIECDNEQVLSTIKFIVKKAIQKKYTDKEIQVLAPMYKSINGIDNLNISLQKIFNPKKNIKKEIALQDVVYRVGDKVLQLVNDTENNVYNGDIGYIVDIIDPKKSITKKREILVDYDGNVVTYTPDKFINIRHAYAISVHKAQGSEFNMIIMPIVNNFNRMLYNKLIYTAVTRAKNSLILVGDRRCFINGVKNDYVENRKTTLKDIILNKYNN